MAVAKKKQESALELCLHFPSFLVHVALVLIVGWISSHFNFSLPLVFTFGLAYLYLVEGRTRAKTETRIRSEERRANDRKRLLSDAETARWLNSTVEAVWPIFLEKFASQKFLMSLAPWFMQKYKPWTAKKVVLQQLYLGRCPPVFTMLRCGRNPKDGDHLVLEMDMKFVAARDMSAVIAVQMKKRVGLGLWTSLNISNIQIEGKLRVGVRFTRGWPLVERLRVCFSEAPILRMTAKPIINYGIDVTDLPGIASWIDKMIADALEHSLVEPNLLEVEVEKLVGSMMAVNAQLPTPSSTKPGPWFSVRNPKLPLVATVTVEILEGKKLKPSDPNGKADPYVNVKLGSAKYVTAIRPKTLKPAWFETFQFPVNSWDVPNKLELRVLDKDRFGHDDNMGYKDIECQAFNDGQRHEMWVTLDEVKTGQLRIAMTVEEVPVVESVTERTKTNGSLESGNAESEISSLVEKVKISAADSQGHENDEDVSDSDYEECALKGEREAVDVGYGHLGAVSIVTPGKAQVKDATNPERLRHRKKPAASSVQVDGDGRSKLRRLLKKDKKFPSQSDSSGELGVIAVGEKGTEVHMTVETDGEGCMNVSDCIPSSGELQLGSGDGQYPDESKTERRGLKKVHNIMFRLGKRAHIVSSAISKMSPSRKRSQSGNNLGETSGNVNQEKAQVPEASTATGESTGDKDVLQAENTSGTERRVNSLNDIETCTEIHESDAETDNRFEDPVASPIVDKKKTPRAQKFRRVEGVRDAGNLESLPVEKPIHHSHAFLAPIKEESRALKVEVQDVLSKMKADCRTAVSIAESVILRKVARSPRGLTRSPEVDEASVNTPSTPISSCNAVASQGSDVQAPQRLKTVVTEEPSSAFEPAVVQPDGYETKSCNSVPCKDGWEVNIGGFLRQISHDDPETSHPSANNNPVDSPSGRRDSPRTPGPIGSTSAKGFFSRVTACKDKGIRRSRSSKEFSSNTTSSFDFTENLSNKAEPGDEGNVEFKPAELSAQTTGALRDDEIQSRQDISESASSPGGSPWNSSLSPSDCASVRDSSDNGASACKDIARITNTSLVSEMGKNVEVSSRSLHPINTSFCDGSLVDKFCHEPTASINAKDEVSSVQVSESRKSSNYDENVVSMSDSSSFREASSTRSISPRALPLTEDSSFLAAAEKEPEIRNIVTSPKEESSQGSEMHPVPPDEMVADCSKDVRIVGSTSAKSFFSRTNGFKQPVNIRSVSSRELAPVTEASSIYNREEVGWKDETNKNKTESLREASNSEASSSVDCLTGISVSYPIKDKFAMREESSSDVTSAGNSFVHNILPTSIAVKDPMSSTERARDPNVFFGSGTEQESFARTEPYKQTTDEMSSILNTSPSSDAS